MTPRSLSQKSPQREQAHVAKQDIAPVLPPLRCGKRRVAWASQQIGE